MEINTLIAKAINKERVAQTALYQMFAPKMLSVCRWYTKDLQHAEDVMVRGFFKAFQDLESFKNTGSFEGWLRQIMTREAIDFIRVHKELDFPENLEFTLQRTQVVKTLDKQHNQEHLQWCIDQLPDGYRVVFILFAIEGYPHKEIAEKLGITEGASKSQLHKARKALQSIVMIEEKEANYER